MKEKLLKCEKCNEQTRHLTTKKMSVHRGSYGVRREVKHCTKCNVRTVHNMKLNRVYKK